MHRDGRGRFIRTTDDQEIEPEQSIRANNRGLLEKPPSVKILIILMLTFWLVSVFSPKLAAELNLKMTQLYCSCEMAVNETDPHSKESAKTKEKETKKESKSIQNCHILNFLKLSKKDLI